MIYLCFLVAFPRFDQAGSSLIAQVDPPSRHAHETVRAYLSAANQGHDEPVCQRPQLFGKVKGKRRPAGTRAMKESHLVVQADALYRADELRHQQTVAEPEHGVDRIAGRPSCPCREPEIARRYSLPHRAEIGSGRISFDTANMVGRICAGQSRNPIQDLCSAHRKTISFGRILLIPSPPVDHFPAVLKFRRYNRLGQRERVSVIRNRPIQGRSQVYVAACRPANDKPNRSTHLQRRDANAASDARLQRLGGDLRAAQHDDGVDRFKWNPLASIW